MKPTLIMYELDFLNSLPTWHGRAKENKVCVHKIRQMRKKKKLSENPLYDFL